MAYAVMILDQTRERPHDQVHVLILELLDDVEVRLLRRVHACVTEPLGNAGNRNPGKEQEGCVGVSESVD